MKTTLLFFTLIAIAAVCAPVLAQEAWWHEELSMPDDPIYAIAFDDEWAITRHDKPIELKVKSGRASFNGALFRWHRGDSNSMYEKTEFPSDWRDVEFDATNSTLTIPNLGGMVGSEKRFIEIAFFHATSQPNPWYAIGLPNREWMFVDLVRNESYFNIKESQIQDLDNIIQDIGVPPYVNGVRWNWWERLNGDDDQGIVSWNEQAPEEIVVFLTGKNDFNFFYLDVVRAEWGDNEVMALEFAVHKNQICAVIIPALLPVSKVRLVAYLTEEPENPLAEIRGSLDGFSHRPIQWVDRQEDFRLTHVRQMSWGEIKNSP